MQYNVKFILLLFILLLSIVKKSRGIVGGEDADLKIWTFLVLIVYDKDVYCGGTLIRPNWVLTAARCVDPTYTGETILLGVRVGINYVHSENGRMITYKELYIHPQFTINSFTGVTVNDIALLRLSETLIIKEGLKIVPISIENIIINSTCITAGWGVNNIDVYNRHNKTADDLYPYPHILKQIQQIPIDISECSKSFGSTTERRALNPEYHVCTRVSYLDYEKTSGPSYGDIGGPLLCGGEQVGIAAFGIYDNNNHPVHMMGWTLLLKYHNWILVTTESKPQFRSNRSDEDYSESFGLGLQDSEANILTSCYVMIKVHMYASMVFYLLFNGQ